MRPWPSFPARRRARGLSTSDPYPLLAAFDRNLLDWHRAAGPWGAREQLQAPEMPLGGGASHEVESTSEFNTRAAEPGATVIVPTGVTLSGFPEVTAEDVTVVVRPGAEIDAALIIAGTSGSPLERVRVHSGDAQLGGRVRSVHLGDHAQSLVLERVRLDNPTGIAITTGQHVSRIWVDECALRASQYVHYVWPNTSDIAFTRCNGIVTQSGSPATRHNSDPGPRRVVYWRCDIKNNWHSIFRVEDSSAYVSYLHGRTRKTGDVLNQSGAVHYGLQPDSQVRAWFVGNHLYDSSVPISRGGIQVVEGRAPYARITHCTWHIDDEDEDLLAELASHEAAAESGEDWDFTTGNVVTGPSTEPAWDLNPVPGDPDA
jgi:hypothetical protein